MEDCELLTRWHDYDGRGDMGRHARPIRQCVLRVILTKTKTMRDNVFVVNDTMVR